MMDFRSRRLDPFGLELDIDLRAALTDDEQVRFRDLFYREKLLVFRGQHLTEDDQVRVSVRDHGIGIPEPEQAEVFNRFFRASNARSHEVPGTGLGLSVVKEVVESHGGRVGLRSEPGRGTEVDVHLPVARPVGQLPVTSRPGSRSA